MEKGIKIILAILLFICLFAMPYGYYQLVRVVAMTAFGYFGLKQLRDDNLGLGVIFLGLAILFQPLIKVPLGREIWNIVDVIVGIWLIYLSIDDKKMSKP